MSLNPHQKKKLDISTLSEEEQKLFRLYGKLPNRKDLLQNKLKERKYFDSGDYAMSKAGKSDGALAGGLGREHPSPDSIPHLSQQQTSTSPPLCTGSGPAGGPASPALQPTHSQGQAGSPVKESTLHRGTSVDEQDGEAVAAELQVRGRQGKGGPAAGVPIPSSS